MLRGIAALLLALAGPAVAQPSASQGDVGYIPPPCHHLYLLHFPTGATTLEAVPEAIAETFAGSHARFETQVRIVARLEADGAPSARQALARRRVAAVREMLAGFGIPNRRIEVAFEDGAVPPHLRGTISLIEIVPPAEMARRRAAWPPDIVC